MITLLNDPVITEDTRYIKLNSDIPSFVDAKALTYTVRDILQDVYQNVLDYRRLIPVRTNFNPNAKFVEVPNSIESFGDVALVDDGYATDIPTPFINADSKTVRQRTYASAVKYSKFQEDAANYAGIDFKEENIRASMRALDMATNTLAFTGALKDGFPILNGWLVNKDVDNQPVAKTTGGTTTWETKNYDQILADLLEAYDFIGNQTLGKSLPDTVALPFAKLRKLKELDQPSSGTPLLEKFLEKVNNGSRAMKFVDSYALRGAFTGGADGFIMYKDDINSFYQIISRTAEPIVGAVEHGIFYSIYFYSTYGGVVINDPKSQVFRYGI